MPTARVWVGELGDTASLPWTLLPVQYFEKTSQERGRGCRGALQKSGRWVFMSGAPQAQTERQRLCVQGGGSVEERLEQVFPKLREKGKGWRLRARGLTHGTHNVWSSHRRM